MKQPITVIPITILLITQCGVHPTSICDSNNRDFNENNRQITSTSDYLELNHKYIDTAKDADPPDPNSVGCNDFVYFSDDDDTFFVRQQNVTEGTKIGGFPSFTPRRRRTSIWLDTSNNLLYFGTKDGLWLISECGGSTANKIDVTDGIDIDFAAIDNTGNIYFGTNRGNIFLLKKDDQQRVIQISGIEHEQSSFGGYDIANVHKTNKIAVDTNNIVYVGPYDGFIYIIKPGESTAIKLKDFKSDNGITSIVADRKDNVYFRTENALYGCKSGGRELTKIVEFIEDNEYSLWLDRNGNLNFKSLEKNYVLLQSEAVTPTTINTISISNGFTASGTDVKEPQNFQVKNNIFYFISTSDSGNDTIFALLPNETSLRLLHTADRGIGSLAIDNSNNIYFDTYSADLDRFQVYVLRINDGDDIPIKIQGITGDVTHLFSDNQNNIFIGSTNGLYVLRDGEVTPLKVSRTGSIRTIVMDRSGNVYFSAWADGDAFVLKSGELKPIRIGGIKEGKGLGLFVYGDKKLDVIYIVTPRVGALYKLNGGEISAKKIAKSNASWFLSNCMNDKTFYGQSDGNISRIFAVNGDDDKNTTLVTEVAGQILHIDSDRFNNLFFTTDTNQLRMVRPTQRKSEVIVSDLEFISLNVDQNNDVYFTSLNGDAYVIRSGEIEKTKIENISGIYRYFLTSDDDILFVTAKVYDQTGLFLIRKKLTFESALTNRDLGQIDNNEDETIFDIWNYLNRNGNYLLSKSKNQIISKTPTSATVVATDGKFRGRFNIAYTIKREDDDNVENVNLIELLTRAAFFEHIAKHSYDFQNKKNIRDISISAGSLTFFPVEVTAKSELTPFYEFKSICFTKKQFVNSSPLPQTIKVQECTYETKETILFRISTGLNKTNSEVQDSMGSVLSSGDENVLLNSFNVYGDSQAGAPAKVTLSNGFDLSNLNQHSHEIVLHTFRENGQEIIVPPKQRALVNYSVRTFVLETALNLQQKIKGRFVAKLSYTDDSYELIQMTIKEAMQLLQKHKLMPSEITFNRDNSVIFNGKGTLTVKRESDTKIIRNFYDL